MCGARAKKLEGITSPRVRRKKCDAIARGEAFVSFPGRLKPTYKRARFSLARLGSTTAWHGRIQNSSSVHSPGRTGREENYLSKPLDRSFSLSHPSLSLSAHRYSPSSASNVPICPAFFLSLFLSFSLSRSFYLFLLVSLAARSTLFLDRRPGSIVFACVRGQGARYFRPSPTRNAVPGGVYHRTTMDDGGGGDGGGGGNGDAAVAD